MRSIKAADFRPQMNDRFTSAGVAEMDQHNVPYSFGIGVRLSPLDYLEADWQ
jgi:hypothetical protein